MMADQLISARLLEKLADEFDENRFEANRLAGADLDVLGDAVSALEDLANRYLDLSDELLAAYNRATRLPLQEKPVAGRDVGF